MTVRDFFGNVVATDDGGLQYNESVRFEASECGLHYVVVGKGDNFPVAPGFNETYAVVVTAIQVSVPESPDIPGDTSTTASVDPGQTADSAFCTPGDHDYFATTLVQDQVYSIDLTPKAQNMVPGFTSGEVMLRDDAGNRLNPSAVSRTIGSKAPKLLFVATYAGKYFIDARSTTDVNVGYALSVQDAELPLPLTIALTEGISEGSTDIPSETGGGFPIAPNQFVTGTVPSGDDGDSFLVELEEDVIYQVDVYGAYGLTSGGTPGGTLANPKVSVGSCTIH